ncbi:MAG: HIG1 domain-containing protein [Rickettsiales bacterium]
MNLLLAILVFAVFIVLISGIFMMGSGGKLNRKYGNKLMTARVSLQGLVLLLVVIIYLMR